MSIWLDDMRGPGAPTPSYERIAEQIKTQAREKQDKIREDETKTEQGIEQTKQQINALRKAISNIKNAIAQLQAQAQQNPQVRNHPLFQKRMAGYQSKLKEYQASLHRAEGQLEMLRSRKAHLSFLFVKIAGQAAQQLAQVRQRFDAQRAQQRAAQQQKGGGGKGESGKVRG